jgi:hypothetical protein
MTIAMKGHEFSEDNARIWKESLRPLSPGRVSEKDDTIRGKPGRSLSRITFIFFLYNVFRSNSVSSSRR